MRSFQRTQEQITPWAGALVKLYIYGDYSSFPITIIPAPLKLYEFGPGETKKKKKASFIVRISADVFYELVRPSCYFIPWTPFT